MPALRNSPSLFILLALLLFSQHCWSGDGKLLATAGATQIEGSAGGGLVPWAVLAGYDSREQYSAGIYSTTVSVNDFRLHTIGLNVGIKDRVELSLAQHNFDLTAAAAEIKQNIYGVKVRLYGDALYSKWPQLSVGLQHKRLVDEDIAQALGASNASSGTDVYFAMTKIHLAALLGYNVVWSLNGRFSKANELGLLGFGGVNNLSYELNLEGSLGLLLSQNIVIGVEYRQKPDNLGLKEDDWRDVFIAYIPNKSFSVTAAWAELGSIAGSQPQKGFYLSLNGNLW